MSARAVLVGGLACSACAETCVGIAFTGVARATVDALRSARTTLVVDMGWPSDDRAYADVATFGASRLIGRALMSLLAAPAGQENHQ